MVAPIKKRAPGMRSEEETPLIKSDRARTAKNKVVGAKSKIKSENAQNSPKNISVKRAAMSDEQKKAALEKQKKPNLKPSQWAEAEALWESGEVTLRELAKRLDRDPSMISRHMTLNNVIQGSKAEEYSRMIREKIAAELSGDAGENAKKIKEMKEEYLKYTAAVNTLAWNEMVTAKQKGLPMQAVFPNLKSIKELMSIFALTKTTNWELMNIIEFEQKFEKEDIPELLISELTSEDIEQMRRDQLQVSDLTGETLAIDLEKIDLDSEELDDDIIEEDEQ